MAPRVFAASSSCFASKSSEFRGQVSGNAYGAAQQNVSGKGIEAVEFNVPPLPEQQKIAAVLGVVQRAMEQQERLLELTAELKKTLLHQLFTQGLRGEPQKQTDIGPVPESWEVVETQRCREAPIRRNTGP